MELNFLQEKLLENGWNLTEDGVNTLSENGNIQDITALTNKAVDLDLRNVSLGTLPDDINRIRYENIPGNIVLQIQKIKNLSSPKGSEISSDVPSLLKLVLTDGIQTVQAVQMDSIPDIHINTYPGSKIYITSKTVDVSHFFLLLNSSNTQFLGGKVESLVEKWELNRSLAKHTRTGVVEGGPPPWIPFGEKIMNHSVSEKSFKSLNIGKVKDPSENSEFEVQRKGAILEATKIGSTKIFGGGNNKLIDYNVQKIIDAGFTIDEAEYTLRVCRNNLDKALRNLQAKYNKEENVKSNTKSSGVEDKKGGKGKNKHRDEDQGQSQKPSGKVSLFEFLEDKLPHSESPPMETKAVIEKKPPNNILKGNNKVIAKPQYERGREAGEEYGKQQNDRGKGAGEECGKQQYERGREAGEEYGKQQNERGKESGEECGKQQYEKGSEAGEEYAKPQYERGSEAGEEYGKSHYEGGREAREEYGKSHYEGGREAREEYGKSHYERGKGAGEEIAKPHFEKGRKPLDEIAKPHFERGKTPSEEMVKPHYERGRILGEEMVKPHYERVRMFGEDKRPSLDRQEIKNHSRRNYDLPKQYGKHDQMERPVRSDRSYSEKKTEFGRFESKRSFESNSRSEKGFSHYKYNKFEQKNGNPDFNPKNEFFKNKPNEKGRGQTVGSQSAVKNYNRSFDAGDYKKQIGFAPINEKPPRFQKYQNQQNDNTMSNIQSWNEQTYNRIPQTNYQSNLQNSMQNSMQNSIQNNMQSNMQNSLQTNIQNSLQTNMQNTLQTNMQNSLQTNLQNSLQTNLQNSLQNSLANLTLQQNLVNFQNQNPQEPYGDILTGVSAANTKQSNMFYQNVVMPASQTGDTRVYGNRANQPPAAAPQSHLNTYPGRNTAGYLQEVKSSNFSAMPNLQEVAFKSSAPVLHGYNDFQSIFAQAARAPSNNFGNPQFVGNQNGVPQPTHKPWIWKKGDKCMARYWEDQMFYNAVVTAVSENTCVVKFTDYGNYEEVLQDHCYPITEES